MQLLRHCLGLADNFTQRRPPALLNWSPQAVSTEDSRICPLSTPCNLSRSTGLQAGDGRLSVWKHQSSCYARRAIPSLVGRGGGAQLIPQCSQPLQDLFERGPTCGA
eukprot:1096669-Pelagomonas_calceolata.AAC.4